MPRKKYLSIGEGRLGQVYGQGSLNKETSTASVYSKGSNPIYSKINRDLLVELGIAGILEKIVVPRIQDMFSRDTLRYFRDCWVQGQTSDIKYLTNNKLYHKQTYFTLRHPEIMDGFELGAVAGYKDPAFIFVQIQTQYNFVERWTVFAGLWFEEIEPSI
jgi:hypothetical protein